MCAGGTHIFLSLSTDRLRPDHLLRRLPLNHRTFGEGPFDLDNVLLRTSGMASTRCAPGLLGTASTTLSIWYDVKNILPFSNSNSIAGSSSVSQREDIPAFSSQFDGTNTLDKSPIALGSQQEIRLRTPCWTDANILVRGRSSDRQSRQEREALECSPAGFDAHDDGPALPRLRYVAGTDGTQNAFLTCLLTDPRMGGGPQRHHSISEFDGNRAPPSGNAQGFYASQRYQGRPNEVEQMMQAKRRMAAQRERELRNYHQEQQYNRSTW